MHWTNSLAKIICVDKIFTIRGLSKLSWIKHNIVMDHFSIDKNFLFCRLLMLILLAKVCIWHCYAIASITYENSLAASWTGVGNVD